jgi:hypothetical protein
MAKDPQSEKTPRADHATEQTGEQARERDVPASSSTSETPAPGTRPKSPREFIQERMRELDKKN